MARIVDVRAGDIVRFEMPGNGLWFYCRVDEPRGDGELMCTVVDAQCWPDAMVEGIVPGRQLLMPRERVLSVVR